MIIVITHDGRCELLDIEEFKAFHIDATKAGRDDVAVAATIGHGAEADGEGHIWVSADRVRDLADRRSDSRWQQNFTRMLEAVRPYGWCSEDLARIRAHVKRA